VEAFGDVVEDQDGRPKHVRVDQLELLPSDEDLRPLADLVGLFPDLTGEQDSTAWVHQQRHDRGHRHG
jgi:hypothetical protein